MTIQWFALVLNIIMASVHVHFGSYGAATACALISILMMFSIYIN